MSFQSRFKNIMSVLEYFKSCTSITTFWKTFYVSRPSSGCFEGQSAFFTVSVNGLDEWKLLYTTFSKMVFYTVRCQNK